MDVTLAMPISAHWLDYFNTGTCNPSGSSGSGSSGSGSSGSGGGGNALEALSDGALFEDVEGDPVEGALYEDAEGDPVEDTLYEDAE